MGLRDSKSRPMPDCHCLPGSTGFIALTGVALPDAPARGRCEALSDRRRHTRSPPTYNGFRRYNAVLRRSPRARRRWRQFGPSLIEAPMMIEEFRYARVVGCAKENFVMKGFADDPDVAPFFVDHIYAYLRARTDGVIGRGRPPQAWHERSVRRSQRPDNPRRRDTGGVRRSAQSICFRPHMPHRGSRG